MYRIYKIQDQLRSVLTFVQHVNQLRYHRGHDRYTERFAGKSAKGHFRGQQHFVISSIGIGTYLGNPDDATDTNYTDAVVRAVQLGSNVIDSAANYRFQSSERSIGQALKITRRRTWHSSVTNLSFAPRVVTCRSMAHRREMSVNT